MSLRNRVTWDGYNFNASLAESLEEAINFFHAADDGLLELGWDADESDLTIRWTDKGAEILQQLRREERHKDE
jgi:hypothetical protein